VGFIKKPQLLALSCFILGIISAILVPRLIFLVANRAIFPEQRIEVSRVTSPDAVVDAVVIEKNCGAPCSINHAVFVVPKGEKVPQDSDQAVFSADDISGDKLVWKESHLLEVSYTRAFIFNFRNVVYPLNASKSARAPAYRVEIRLAPSSAGFSYLSESEARHGR